MKVWTQEGDNLVCPLLGQIRKHLPEWQETADMDFIDLYPLRLLWRGDVLGWQYYISIADCSRRNPYRLVLVEPMYGRDSIAKYRSIDPHLLVRVNDLPFLASDCVEGRISWRNDDHRQCNERNSGYAVDDDSSFHA